MHPYGKWVEGWRDHFYKFRPWKEYAWGQKPLERKVAEEVILRKPYASRHYAWKDTGLFKRVLVPLPMSHPEGHLRLAYPIPSSVYMDHYTLFCPNRLQ